MRKINNNTIASVSEPKAKNVSWLDTSLNPPVLKMFVNGRFIPISDIQNSKKGSSYQLIGIPYDLLVPTLMRDITEEDLVKLPEPEEGYAFYKAIDLQNGIIPYFILYDNGNDDIKTCFLEYVIPLDGSIYYYDPDDNLIIYYISSDGSFMALKEEEHESNKL